MTEERLRRKRRRLPRLARGVLLALVIGWAFSLAAVVWKGKRDEARPAAAIVVLGAAQYVGRPSPVLRARLDHGIALWRRRLAPRIIFTGGRGDGDTISEAEVSRRYAMLRGVPDSAIVLEPRGRTTRESLRGVAAIMRRARARGGERAGAGRAVDVPGREVILVSDPFHMLRLSILARRLGLDPLTSPTRTSPISTRREESWRYLVGESLKVPVVFFFERRGQ